MQRGANKNYESQVEMPFSPLGHQSGYLLSNYRKCQQLFRHSRHLEITYNNIHDYQFIVIIVAGCAFVISIKRPWSCENEGTEHVNEAAFRGQTLPSSSYSI